MYRTQREHFTMKTLDPKFSKLLPTFEYIEQPVCDFIET